jgi:hypothetical protein
MKTQFERIGSALGFSTRSELSIPTGKVDCIWEVKNPCYPPYIFAAFEFETSTTGTQIVGNLAKQLSVPPPQRPRFLIQVYRDTPRYLDYLEEISSKLPLSTKIIPDVGADPEQASQQVLIDVFNWMSEYIELPLQFVNNVETVINYTIPKIFHYGELNTRHLIPLDRAIKTSMEQAVYIRSVPTQREEYAFPPLDNYDIVILSDVSLQYCAIEKIRQFLTQVQMAGKSLIITGGYGLTKDYHVQLGAETIGGIIGQRFSTGRIKRLGKTHARIKTGIGSGLAFRGFNIVKPENADEVISTWDIGDHPALIIHSHGKGHVILFTSDLSPSWGTDAIDDQRFMNMWKTITEDYLRN